MEHDAYYDLQRAHHNSLLSGIIVRSSIRHCCDHLMWYPYSQNHPLNTLPLSSLLRGTFCLRRLTIVVVRRWLTAIGSVACCPSFVTGCLSWKNCFRREQKGTGQSCSPINCPNHLLFCPVIPHRTCLLRSGMILVLTCSDPSASR